MNLYTICLVQIAVYHFVGLIPALVDVKSQNWRDEFLGEIKKVREVD